MTDPCVEAVAPLPCPFCGSEKLRVTECEDCGPDAGWTARIMCCECDTMAPPGENWHVTQDQAINAAYRSWNTRAAMHSSRPVEDGLVEQLRQPKQWCCIFEHEGHMRHGTSDAPFKAASELSALKGEIETLRRDLAAIPCQTKGNEDAESGCCAPCRARQALTPEKATTKAGDDK